MARLVQLADQTKLDSGPGDHRADLADSLSDHPGQFRVRVRAGDPKESTLAGRLALRHQSRGQPDFHADSIRDAEPAAGGSGYSDRVGDDHLDGRCRLAALPLGGRGPGAVFRLGIDCDRAATFDYGDELGETVIHKMLVLPLPILMGSFVMAEDKQVL